MKSIYLNKKKTHNFCGNVFSINLSTLITRNEERNLNKKGDLAEFKYITKPNLGQPTKSSAVGSPEVFP